MTAAPRPAAALGVVRRRRRHIAHVDGVQRGDVHAQLHRWRAVQEPQPGIAELLLALLAHAGIHLGGVLPCLQGLHKGPALGLARVGNQRSKVFVEVAEVGIHRPALATGFQLLAQPLGIPVLRRSIRIHQRPAQG